MTQPRRSFLRNSLATAVGLGWVPIMAHKRPGLIQDQPIPSEFPSQTREAVKHMVGVSHGRIDQVQELLAVRPALANASWDWGFGDWETAIGAASHMGRADIVQLLVDHGARPNLFAYTCLGNVKAVKAMIEAIPGIQTEHGPHGITLLRHARIRMGMDDISDQDKLNMEEIVSFLEKVGNADEGQFRIAQSAEEKEQYLGKYIFGESPNDYFNVELNTRGDLYIARGEDFGRTLFNVGDHAFAPSGAPAVRIQFNVSDGNIASLTVHDPEPLVTALR